MQEQRVGNDQGEESTVEGNRPQWPFALAHMPQISVVTESCVMRTFFDIYNWHVPPSSSATITNDHKATSLVHLVILNLSATYRNGCRH
jgi:hypothetical protein